MSDRHAEESPIKTLSSSQLNIKGLQLLGHAKFRKTFEALPIHSHQGMEFIAMLKGTQRYMVNECLYTLRGGEIFMTFPGEVHWNGDYPQDVAEIVWFQIDCSDSENFLGLPAPYSDFLYEKISNYKNRITSTNQKDLNQLRSAFLLLNEKDPQKRLLGYNHFLEFIIKNFGMDQDSSKEYTESERENAILHAVDFIHKHLTENPSLESIAEHCGLSFSKLNRLFKEQMGITPHSYMMKCKIELAKQMLKDPQYTVSDVAFHLNFSSSDYFSSVFKKYTGYTPTQCR